jgi:hypothetical protein
MAAALQQAVIHIRAIASMNPRPGRSDNRKRAAFLGDLAIMPSSQIVNGRGVNDYPQKGQGTKIMPPVGGQGTPLAADIASASEAEVNLVEPLLNKRTIRRRPRRVIYNPAADRDRLRSRLKTRRLELICAHRKNRTRPAIPDGRTLRRYQRRYQVERRIRWLLNCRRLLALHERYARLFPGFV